MRGASLGLYWPEKEKIKGRSPRRKNAGAGPQHGAHQLAMNLQAIHRESSVKQMNGRSHPSVISALSLGHSSNLTSDPCRDPFAGSGTSKLPFSSRRSGATGRGTVNTNRAILPWLDQYGVLAAPDLILLTDPMPVCFSKNLCFHKSSPANLSILRKEISHLFN